ncbi:transcriptional regulator BetI [Paracoccus sp. R12_1]|uniref:choline-binding transcriptional repressor BetI n=1 Tax=unclassified Paracoccus (in: a-proteobacteria) TaxID=2688777 RepID=UPI001ADD105C|nr:MULTISPECIES: transcriptional regulator BetI [unclassified Paracoccus (in: a-proteobacteria)]MBO9455947.1 transcriptional regulator BetI [Paracoccus sp. R12_2]MBO9486637.1 transcriptional regulator BetI [Paracoccus sp. R12_1]
MPKLGAEPIRKAALINAVIHEVGQAGSLDVTVAQIARRAGMSPALAHHYFGSKDQMFLQAMRYILRVYGNSVLTALQSRGRNRRLEAIVEASFAPQNFRRETVSAWLNFYVLALTEPEAARLLRVYHRRLESNLIVALRPLTDHPRRTARTIGALIDGVYLRAVLRPGPTDAEAAMKTMMDYIEEALA